MFKSHIFSGIHVEKKSFFSNGSLHSHRNSSKDFVNIRDNMSPFYSGWGVGMGARILFEMKVRDKTSDELFDSIAQRVKFCRL